MACFYVYCFPVTNFRQNGDKLVKMDSSLFPLEVRPLTSRKVIIFNFSFPRPLLINGSLLLKLFHFAFLLFKFTTCSFFILGFPFKIHHSVSLISQHLQTPMKLSYAHLPTQFQKLRLVTYVCKVHCRLISF